jgi:2-polyprenyl-3-methyl-5-hydroxy-6-metoxy-1,4-benzoquinol methylase
MRWDISRPPPVRQQFDFVICRASIHHTPDPPVTFKSLVLQGLAPGGIIAISAYAKKSRPREAIDDVLRAEISKMPVAAAKEVVHEFTRLAREIQKTKARIQISQTLPFLGIPAGDYEVHDFIYNFLIKNWYIPTH